MAQPARAQCDDGNAGTVDDRCVANRRCIGTPITGGDCDGDGSVAISDVIRGVNIALGNAAVDTCQSFDADGNGMVSINELILAVSGALGACG